MLIRQENLSLIVRTAAPEVARFPPVQRSRAFAQLLLGVMLGKNSDDFVLHLGAAVVTKLGSAIVVFGFSLARHHLGIRFDL